MANLHRIIFSLLSFLVAADAFALAPTTYWREYYTNPTNHNSSAAACGAGAAAWLVINTPQNITYTSFSGSSCLGTHVSANGGVTTPNTVYSSAWTVTACPAGYTKSGTAPNEICTSTTNCSTKAGQVLSSGGYNVGTDPNTSNYVFVCDGSCTATFSGGVVSRALILGVYNYRAEGSFVYDGSSCSGASTLPPSQSVLPPDTCPPGQTLGTLNGKKMCLAAGVPQNPNPAPPAVTPGTTSTTVTNPDNSTTTTTTTTNGDGSKTITITNNLPGGAPGTTKTTNEDPPSEDPVDDFCKDNPDSPMCKKNESKFGGGCGAFSCEGDAIQCAIAREQHTRNCTLFDTTTPMSDLGNAAAAGTDTGTTTNPALAANRSVVNIPGVLDTSKGLSASCVPDLTVQIINVSFTVPFSRVCPYLEIMGSVVIAFSLLAGGRIIAGGVA